MILDNDLPDNNPKFHPTHKWFLGCGILLLIISFYLSLGYGNTAVDLQMHDTYFVIALFYIPFGFGLLFLFFAGVYYFLNISLKKALHVGMSKFHFWVSFLLVSGILFIVLKSTNRPRKYFSTEVTETAMINYFQTLNDLVWIFLLVFFACQCIFIINIIRSICNSQGNSKS